MVEDFKQNEQKIKALFQKAEEIPLNPSPFLKGRILAFVQEAQSRKEVRTWRWISMASLSFAFSLLFVFWFESQTHVFQATLQNPLAVRVEVEKNPNQVIAFARVELPEGVVFYPERYPELTGVKVLTLPWQKEFEKQSMPIVVQGEEVGTKAIRVLLLDEKERILEEKKITIRFS